MVDLVGRAFDKADEYRMPAMILADGMLGQMMEPVEIGEGSGGSSVEKPGRHAATTADASII